MTLYRAESGSIARVCTAIAIVLAVSLLVGCGSSSTSITETSSVGVPTSIPVPTPSATHSLPTPTLNYKEDAFAQLTATMVAERTAVALTGIPTWTPGPPPSLPGPTSTPLLGLSTDCVNQNALVPQIITCWTGDLNGHLVNVNSGREGRAGDPNQGIVILYTWGTTDTLILPTPDKVGPVQITAINGSRFTLTTVNHQPPITYILDIATRQWVNP
jgi:hypothetical protein